MNNRLKTLLSLPFVICLTLLLLNDFYLKDAFHNMFTGKLSDLSGLFIFPVFWSVLFPKHRSWIFILSGALFIYWKSEYFSVLIELISRYFFSVQRTIDYTDLFTLPVLVLAWFSLKKDNANVKFSGFLKNVSPYPVAALTIFSFCATSQARYIQTFEQPQYVLFKSEALPDTSQLDEDFRFFQIDSLLIVQVKQLHFNDRPAKYDDYNKNLAIKDLDKTVYNIVPGITSLVPNGDITTITINTPQSDDDLRFSGGRLDGKFIRKKDGKVLIDGTYKAGLEDSIWTFKNIDNDKVTKITFVNGEKTLLQQFQGENLTLSNKFNTRSDVKIIKITQIAMLVLLLAGSITLIIRNYRNRNAEKQQLSLTWKWLACLTLPLVVWVLQLAITLLLGDYQFDLFIVPVTLFIVYLITCPLFFIILFGIRLGRRIDVLWYTLLFAFAIGIWIEYDILSALSA